MKRDLTLALLTYGVLLLFSLTASILFGLGKAESARELSSLWWYGRRALLVIAALSLPWLTRKQTISALGWKFPVKWILFSVAVGVCLGLGNRGGFNPKNPYSLPLALCHTFSMELFFRGYLFTTLDRCIKGLWKPLLLSSLLYALFYQTMWTTWIQSGVGKVALFLSFTFLGVLFAYCYKKSGSFWVNWTMHLFAGIQYRMLF